MIYNISLKWDEEAQVWIATSPDIHGLVLETESLDQMMKEINYTVPELLEEHSEEISLNIQTKRKLKVN